MDHTLHTPLEAFEINAANIVDAPVYGPEDEKIGTIAHVHGEGADMAVIVDVGGFLGLGAKPVAIAASSLTFMRDTDGEVHATTLRTKAELKELPEHHH